MTDYEIDKKLAWAEVVENRRKWDRLAICALSLAVLYPLSVWLFELHTTIVENVAFVALVIGGKYYAQYQIDLLTKSYYKEFPPR